MASRLTRLLVAALLVAGLDQITKALAVNYLAAGGVVVLRNFFDLVLVYNRGAAFSLLSGLTHANWILMALSLLALVAAVLLVMSKAGSQRFVVNCLGVVVGGAMGNFTDRVRLGAVVDFMDLHWKDLHWPVFNVADLAISLGGIYLGILLLRGKL